MLPPQLIKRKQHLKNSNIENVLQIPAGELIGYIHIALWSIVNPGI